MTSVGYQLRQERLRRGLQLADLARGTRINLGYLEAIEADAKSKIPGGFFYRSFVRQYAEALGLDGPEFEADLERTSEAGATAATAAVANIKVPAKAEFPMRTPNAIVMASNRGSASGRAWAYGLLLLGVLALCAGLYGWWHHVEANMVSVADVPTTKVEKPQPKH